MKLLVCLSLYFGITFSQLELGPYKYQYNNGQISRDEMRFPNGTVSGRYNFLDENNLNHELVYTAGSNQGFKVLSHQVAGNGETYNVNLDHAPEVQNAQDSHVAFQNYLQMVLPQISDDELPPVYIRHVPSPVKEEPVVPIIPVIPPMKYIQQQIQDTTQVVNNSPRKVLVVKDLPPHAQLGSARALFVQDFQPHVSVKVEEIPVDFMHTADRLHPISVPQVQSHPKSLQYLSHQVQPEVSQQTHHPVQSIQPQSHQVQQKVQPQIQYQQQEHPQSPVEIVYQPVTEVPTQTVPQYIQQQPYHGMTTQDEQLVNGLTVEVAKPTQEDLSHVAAVKASLQTEKHA